ncbi:hypothetical protein [Streptomyces chartreusis]
MTDRDELTSYEYRQLSARLMRADVCVVCALACPTPSTTSAP